MIPVTVLSGFLGSGMTTLLDHMLILGALLLGIIAPPIGIAASASFNLPTGPSIVHVAALATCQLLRLIRPLRGLPA
jgi:ABC-type Mn2+/Zn2+ transport system permease subunit